MKENELKKQAMGIVNQLFDLAEVPVEKRQEINDKADEYMTEQLMLGGVVCQREQLLAFKKWEAEKCRLPWDASPEQIVEQYLSQ